MANKIFDGNKLRLIREKRKKSQKELAKAVGVKQEVISKWELNQKSPSDHFQKAMAKFLFVGTYEFQEDADKVKPYEGPTGKRVPTPFNYSLFKYLREKKSLSKRDMAKMLGCEVRTIIVWENGVSPARVSTQEKIAEILEIPNSMSSCENGSFTPEDYEHAVNIQLELPIEEMQKPAKSDSIIENLQDYVLLTKETYQQLVDDQERLRQIQEAIGGKI